MTDEQHNLLEPLNRAWAIIDTSCNNLLENHISEADAKYQLEAFGDWEPAKNYRIVPITWVPATKEVAAAMRAMDEWMESDVANR